MFRNSISFTIVVGELCDQENLMKKSTKEQKNNEKGMSRISMGKKMKKRIKKGNPNKNSIIATKKKKEMLKEKGRREREEDQGAKEEELFILAVHL